MHQCERCGTVWVADPNDEDGDCCPDCGEVVEFVENLDVMERLAYLS